MLARGSVIKSFLAKDSRRVRTGGQCAHAARHAIEVKLFDFFENVVARAGTPAVDQVKRILADTERLIRIALRISK